MANNKNSESALKNRSFEELSKAEQAQRRKRWNVPIGIVKPAPKKKEDKK